MARDSHDREDLLRDARAFPRRVELQLRGGAEDATVFAGFRTAGGVSLFFGGDPVYHFNAAGELRRAFVDDALFKAERGQLVRMTPERTERETALHSRVLDDGEYQRFASELSARLASLAEQLTRSEACLLGEVPPGGGVREELARWLGAWRGVVVAESPRVG
jgi:hypothetical protein